MSANILQTEKIKIVDFKIIKGQINSPFDFNEENIEGHSFNVNFELGFNLEDKLVKADFSVNVETKSNNKDIEEAAGNFSFVYIFYVDNLEELAIQEEDHTITVNSFLGNALASITYSTSRGILMTRFQGTILRDFILPVIDPNSLLE
jgi:hypothetical protein